MDRQATNGGYGNVVKIAHGPDCFTRYAHLARFLGSVETYVQGGYQQPPPFVAKGDPLGVEGNTGYVIGGDGQMPGSGDLDHGRHLHHELWIRTQGQWFDVNPRAYVIVAQPSTRTNNEPLPPVIPARLTLETAERLAERIRIDYGVTGLRAVENLIEQAIKQLKESEAAAGVPR
jgi:murein DD-endopeptidase MepM/ murein hydrolase activator NlpD